MFWFELLYGDVGLFVTCQAEAHGGCGNVKLVHLDIFSALLQPKSLAEMTGYMLVDLMPCIEDLHKIFLSAAQHAQQSVREKYKASR